VLVGDDYLFPGVKEGVNEFFNALGHPYFVIRDAQTSHETFYAVKGTDLKPDVG
jgi:hypothetical protein